MELVVFSILNGIVFGLLLFMMSAGLTLIFSMMGVLNFAHASFYMLGAYFAFQISQAVGFWPALIFAPLIVGVAGGLVERYGLRRVHKFGHVPELLFTFGLAFLIQEIVVLIWGRVEVPYRVPEILDFPLFTLFGTNFPAYRAFMMLISIGMFVGLYTVLTRTRIGLIVQASLTHPNIASSLGHNVPRVFMYVFAGGTALAGLAGVIGGNAFVTNPSMAALLGTIVFVVVIVGGLGSLTGAFIAAMFIGIVQTFSVALDISVGSFFGLVGLDLSSTSVLYEYWTLSLTDIAPVTPYLLLVLILIFRPMGLLGKRET